MKKIMVIAAILIIAVIVIISIFIFTNRSKIASVPIERGFGAVERMALMNRPQSISQDSVRTVFTNTVNRIKTGEVNQLELKKVLSNLRVSLSDNKLDSLEVINLLNEMNQLVE